MVQSMILLRILRSAWLRAQTAGAFVVFSLVFVFLFALVAARYMPTDKLSGCDREGAKEALGLLKDTTQWLAGIQTATLAALALIAREGIGSVKPSLGQIRLAIFVAVLNTSALFSSAWVLTALPTVMLRVQSDPVNNYDFFNLPIYPWFSRNAFSQLLTVQFFAFCNHWFWALGVLLSGWLCISMTLSRSKKVLTAPSSRAARRRLVRTKPSTDQSSRR